MALSIATSSTPTSPTNDNDDDCSQSSFSSSPLNFHQSIILARRMKHALECNTKDRTWRLKNYQDCFKASHAIAWSLENINTDELIAVNRLNQLIDYGLLTHVVDPSKKIRLGEKRTLYFRIVSDELLDRWDLASSPTSHHSNIIGKGVPLMAGKFGSGISRPAVRSITFDTDNMNVQQQQIHNLDHILQETVKELNETRGRLEMVHQEVRELISQQISMFIMMFVMFMTCIVVMVPMMEMNRFATIGVMAVTIIVSTRFCWKHISLWGDIDSSRTSVVPIDSIDLIGNEDCSSDAEGSIIRKSFHRSNSTPLSITKSFLRSVSGSSKRQSQQTRLSQIMKERPITVMREAYTLPDVEKWPHRPLMVCINTPVVSNLAPDFGVGPIPLGVSFKFSSDLFEGTCLFRLKGSNSDDPKGDEAYFSGRKRIYQSVVQGRFKEELSVCDIMTGHEFAKPLKNLPHPFILKTATNFIGKIALGSNIAVHTAQPFMEATLLGTSQVVRGDEPGNEPDISCRDIEEDCSIFGGAFTKGNVSPSRRKRIFSNPAKAEKYTVDTETVYTFEFYQNLFDVSTYSLDLGFAKLGATKVLNGQPIQWLGKMRDGRYLWVRTCFKSFFCALNRDARPHLANNTTLFIHSHFKFGMKSCCFREMRDDCVSLYLYFRLYI